jgi:hypothetical protein
LGFAKEDSVKSGDKLQKLLILLVTWGLLVVFFAGYEIYFVRGQEQFLQANGFRSLAALAKGLTAKVTKARASTESLVRFVSEKTRDPQEIHAYLKLYLDSPTIAGTEQDLRKCALITSPGNRTHVPLAFIPRENALMLTVSCFERNTDDTPKPDRPIPLYTVDIRSWLTDAFQEQTNDFDDVLIADQSGRVLLEESNRGPRIANLKAFMSESDDSAQPTERKDTKKAAKDKQASADSSSPKGEDKTEAGNADYRDDERRLNEPQKLAAASSVTKITYAGKSYRVFSHPIRIWLPSTPTSGKALSLGIYGLWDGDRFESASRRIPYSTLIWAALIVVALLSLTWPLFKLRYMGNTERFNASDGWLLILAVSLASASITLMLLNASYVAHAQADIDQAMKNLASDIKCHLQMEMTRANQQLAEFRKHPAKEGSLLANYLKPGEPQSGADVESYPYFDGVSWINDTGMQVAKVDVKAAPTPYVPVLTRQYYRSVVSDSKRRKESDGQLGAQTTETPQSGANVSYLEPILSTNTDEFYAVLSGPFNDEGKASGNKTVVVALTTRPLSLVDPVLPPGYRFAVIDHDCNVMFHSDSFRDRRENFCDESKDQDELRPWLFAGVDASFDISYQGHPVRAFMTAIDAPPFVDRQPFLLVFRESDLDLTLNLAIVLVCAVLLTTYFSLLVAIAVTYLLLKGPLRLIYPPRFVWPQPDKGVRYVQLFGANVALLLLFWFFYPKLYEAPLIGLTIAIAVVAPLLALFTLASARWGPIVLSGLLICGTVAAGAALLHYDADSFLDWEPVLALLAGASLIAVLFAEAISGPVTTFAASIVSHGVKWLKTWFRVEAPRPIRSWVGRVSASLSEPGWLTRSAQKHFGLTYVLLILSIVTATVLVPCIGFFKYAYDAVSELSLKHDELVLSKRVLDRRARIRQYYDDKVIAPSEIAKRRFDESLDRYDIVPGQFMGVERPVFAVGDLGFFDSPPLTLLQEKGAKLCAEDARHESNVGINDLLERWMARATLKFPENSLGQEMSKLGVASSEANSSAWTEMCSTNFQLALKTPSGSRYLTVASTYRDWWGLRWRDRILLLTLWIILSVWLLVVVNKIFFATTEDPPFDTVDWKEVSDIKKNFLIIERAKSGQSQWMDTIANLAPDSRLDLRLELKKIVDDKSMATNSTSSIVILDHFEFNLRDSKYNLARIELLEKLLLDTTRKVVLVSTVDPLFFLTESGSGVLSESKDPAIANQLLDRWAEVLGRFMKVHPKDLSDREFHQTLELFDKAHGEEGDRHKTCRQLAIWIKQECDVTTRLRRIGKELLDEYRERDCHASHEWVVNRVLDLSDSYYHVLWSGLTTSERLVLYQLAMDGWANPKNITSIRQLERKLLISRRPMYRIMNESFRRFVQGSKNGAEIDQWQKGEQQSTWRAFRFVAIAAGVGIGVWMLYTQAAFSQTIVGFIAAIATLLTAVAGLFGRSGGSAAGAKPE